MENSGTYTGKSPKDSYNNAASKVDGYSNSVATGAERVWEKAKDVEKTLATRYQSVKEMALDGYDTTTEVVRKYPMSTLVAATATGLFAGLLLARRKK
ncbi:MAG: hypothetical protein H7Z71_03585 [Moraxellaceae bacterium]|nr:hypothetical protein [Pseudobdellovibrionaceae bacterium]